MCTGADKERHTHSALRPRVRGAAHGARTVECSALTRRPASVWPLFAHRVRMLRPYLMRALPLVKPRADRPTARR